MDELLTIFGLSFAMLVGCYLAGIIPLTISLSEEKLKMVTVLGAGLLVGTALAVIIPEGVHAMYSNGGGHSHDHTLELKEMEHKEPVEVKESVVLAGAVEHSTDAHEHHSDDMANAHSMIGVSLVTGFIFMLLVDQIGGNMHSHSSGNEVEAAGAVQNRNKITATLGLVVHAAADGVALGAAVSLSENHITMIVFVAIMLHKAPAAFGLVSFLLHAGFDRARIRKHLAVFSVSAPLLAIITYMLLSQQNKETLSNMHTTGIAMLFSAGTFLYVATVHVLPEISTSTTQHTSLDGTVVVREQKGFKKTELAALVIGAVLPVILAMGHKH